MKAIITVIDDNEKVIVENKLIESSEPRIVRDSINGECMMQQYDFVFSVTQCYIEPVNPTAS